MRRLSIVLALSVLMVVSVSLLACTGGGGGGSEMTVTGLITKVDVNAKTFSLNGGGKDYDFKMVAASKGDISEIKEHLDEKKQVDVKYKNTGSPYEVVAAD